MVTAILPLFVWWSLHIHGWIERYVYPLPLNRLPFLWPTVSHCFLLNMYFHWFNWIHIFRAHLHLNWSNLLFCPWNGNPFKIQLSSFIDSWCSLLEISSIPKCSLLSESSNSSKKTWFSLLTKASRQARLSCCERSEFGASKWCGKLGIWKAFSRYARSQFAADASIPLGFHEKWSHLLRAPGP